MTDTRWDIHLYRPGDADPKHVPVTDLHILLARGLRQTRALAAQQADAGQSPADALERAERGEELIEWLDASARAEEDRCF